MSYRLIGITGYAGSGKDTVAALLTHHYEFTCVAIADRIREFVCTQARALQRRVEAEGWDAVKQDSAIRRLLETTGEAFRSTFPNLLLNSVLPDWKWGNWDHAVSWHNMPPYYAITDIRHEEEAHRLRSWGGDLWCVCRKSAPLVYEGDAGVGKLPITHYIQNNGSLVDLEEVVLGLL